MEKTMTPAERLDYLIRTLSGNNAAEFCRRCGMRRDVPARIRSGNLRVKGYADRICAAYPEVNKEWLLTGRGEPGVEPGDVFGRMIARVDALEGRMDVLLGRIDALLGEMEKASPVVRRGRPTLPE